MTADYNETDLAIWQRDCLDYFLAANVHSVLEVGCGWGDWSLLFARHGMHVKAYDASSESIERARHRAKEERLRIDFEVAPLTDPPFEYESFDAVVAALCLDRHSRREMFLSLDRLGKRIKKGGLLYALFHPYVAPEEPPPGYVNYRNGELKNAFFGFRPLQIQSYPGGYRGYFLQKL